MKRHSTDLVSLVFGLIFVSIAGWWLIGRYLDLNWNIPNFGWIAAGALILLGLLGVAASLRGDKPAAVAGATGAPGGDASDLASTVEFGNRQS